MRALLSRLSLQRRLVTVTVALVAVAVVATTAVGLISARQLSGEAEQRELHRTADALAVDLDAIAFQGASVATSLATNPDITAAFAARDRERLLELTEAPFAALQAEYGAAQLQFHTPPATSFLRTHMPENFGDDLSDFRQTVLDANAQQTTVTGLELGVGGLGMRAVVPVEHQGEHIGSVEIGASFGDDFFARFSEANGVDVALYLAAGDRIEEGQVTGAGAADFTTFASTLGEEPLVDDAVLASVLRGEIVDGTTRLNGTPHATRHLPITDFTETPIGVAVVAVPVAELAAMQNQARTLLIGLGLLVLLFGAVATWFLARSIARQVSSSAEELVGASGRIEALALRVGDVAGSTADRAGSVAGAGEEVSTNTQTVASAVEELNAAIAEIARNAEQATSVATEAIDTSTAASEKVSALEGASEEIAGVVELITSIAEQTNLLALNATIEAARAGEAGKGFAVVAGEVKDLATETAQATARISDRVGAIRTGTADVAATMSGVGEVVERIADLQRAIAAAVEEQQVTTAEVSRSVGEVATGSTEISSSIHTVADAANESSDNARQLVDAAGELNQMSDRLRAVVEGAHSGGPDGGGSAGVVGAPVAGEARVRPTDVAGDLHTEPGRRLEGVGGRR